MYVHMCVCMFVFVIDGGMEVVLVSKPFSAEAGCSDWVMLLQIYHIVCSRNGHMYVRMYVCVHTYVHM